VREGGGEGGREGKKCRERARDWDTCTHHTLTPRERKREKKKKKKKKEMTNKYTSRPHIHKKGRRATSSGSTRRGDLFSYIGFCFRVLCRRSGKEEKREERGK